MKFVYQSFLILFALAGCSQTNAFVDSRREAGQTYKVGQSTPDKVAICYRFWEKEQKKIMELAVNECAKTGRRPVFSHKEKFNCRLFIPNTVFFDCVK